MSLTISETDYAEILMEIGYPVITETDLEFTREQIQSLMIAPALRQYFIWFPITEQTSHMVTNTFEIPFPDDKTYGIIDARINTDAVNGGRTGSPYMNELLISTQKLSSGYYGTSYDYGITEARYLENAYAKSARGVIKAQNIRVDTIHKVIKGSTTVAGELIVTWAKYSENMDDVPYRRKGEVKALAKSNVLRAFSQLRSQIDYETGTAINTSELMERANNLEESIMSKWKEFTKVVVIRG